MKRAKKNYLFIIKTTENMDGIPEGSGVYVEKQSKEYYEGKWSSMNGTCNVKIPKDKCVKLDNLK